MTKNHLKIDEKYKNFTIPDVAEINPEEKECAGYYKQMLEGFYSAYIRGTTGISLDDVDRFALNRAYGRGNHPTEHIKTYLSGKEKYPSTGSVAAFSNNDEKAIVTLARKAWDNIDWRPISPMPKIKAVNSRLAEIDYDVVADRVDPTSRDKEMDEKAKTAFFALYQDVLNQFAKNAGVPLDEPQFIPKSVEELNMYEAAEGFKPAHAKWLEVLMKYTFDFGYYEEINEQHKEDLQDLGWILLRIEKDENSGRFYPVYVDPAMAFIQSSIYPDHRDSEYAGEFTYTTISKLLSYGFPLAEVKKSMAYYSGWNGNLIIDEKYVNETTRFSQNYLNMKVCVVNGTWIDTDTEYRKIYKDRNGQERRMNQGGEEWGKFYNNANRKTEQVRCRVAREGSWVVGTDMVYGYGKVSNQAREDDRDVLLTYRCYKLPFTPLTEINMPFIDGIQTGWAKVQNALVVAMNSGYAVNVSMLNNLSHGKDSIDWVDAIKVMRGMGVLPYSQSISGRYQGGAVSPVVPFEGGLGQMLQDGLSIMDVNMQNIYKFSGMNPVSLGDSTGQPEAVRNNQMLMSGTQEVLKPLIRASFRMKGMAAQVVNNRLMTCLHDKGYMKKAYGGILGEAGIWTLSQAKKTGVQYGTRLRVRPTDEEKQRLYQAADIALQGGLIDLAIHSFIVEQLSAGTNMKAIRLQLTYSIEKERERKLEEDKARIREQSEGNIAYEQSKQQTLQMESELKKRMETELEMLRHTHKVKEIQELRITELMKAAAQDETKRDELLKQVQDEASGQAGNATRPADRGQINPVPEQPVVEQPTGQ